MNALVNNIKPLLNGLWSIKDPNSPSKVYKLSVAVGKVFTEKERLIEESLANKTRRFHPLTGSCSTQIIHDVVNALFVVFTVIKVALPSIAKLAPVMIASSIFGVVGGALNLAVGGITLREALQAFRNKEKAKAGRLLVCAVALLGLGVFMILSFITTYVAIGGIGAFIAANPWILSVLVLALMLPLLYEVVRDNKSIFIGQDPYAKMQMKKMEDLLNKDIVDWQQIQKLLESTDMNYESIRTKFQEQELKSLIARMEVLQSKIGARGAVAFFKLFQAILDRKKEDAQKHIKELKGHAVLWKRSQYLCLFQQVLFMGSFILSLFALKRVDTRLIESIDDGLMILGMGIPVYMDTFWPLLRNVPIVVPKVTSESIQ